jgi:F-type H+-transporting ATPase subunit delta
MIEIADAYIEQFNTLRNIYRVKLTTATPVSDDIKTAILGKIRSSTPMQNIELETVVKEELIGGFLLEMGGTLVDTSIQRDLKDIRRQFMDNEYIHKIR